MTAYLINKNLALQYRLRKTIGRGMALKICKAIDKVILVAGRDAIPIHLKEGRV